ncbi:MAG: hypothetical protein GXO64_01955 [Candidatus Micrarchaeota archaeon]|nr:hypothetical protein [Candidatus Micrarchaeota archaeon]
MKGKSLREKIYEHIELNWPINTKEIAIAIGLEPENSNIKKISYHMKKLEKEERIMTRRIGKALVAWPFEIEKLRTIQEFLKT